MKITIARECVLCGEIHVVRCPFEGFLDWQMDGQPIQNAMPELSATEREQLISDICPECQNRFFSDEEEEG